jgi:hypothetical protein
MTPTRQRLGTGRPAGAGPPAARPQPAAAPPEAEPAEAAQAAAAPVEAPAETAAEAQPAAAAAAPVDGEAAAPPAAAPAQPAVPAPARPAPAAPRPAPAAARPAPAAAGAAARPAPAARPAAAGATAQRLAAAVREPSAGGQPQQQGLVYVWPHLVTIEFISAALLMVSMIVLSWVVNSPLEGHANPDKTPNPSKAPWYFLNLQELLLHMHPALAGVLVPAGALALIAAIPYFDRDQRDVGKWFGTRAAVPITIFVSIYTTIVEVALVFFDELKGVKPLMRDVSNFVAQVIPGDIGRVLADYIIATEPGGLAIFSLSNVIVPTLLMLGPIVPMLWVIHRLWKPTTRDVMIALFTGFVVSYVILTIFGTFFRGQGMHLCWMTDPCQIRIE